MKDFKVNHEILDLFRNETVSAKSVKKLIPNYMEYQIKKPELIVSKYLPDSACKLYNYLTSSHWVTAQEFLDGIESILVYEGLLRKDNSQEIFNFDGSTLDEGYSYYQIAETIEKTFFESESALLDRICKEIREAEKKEKELQNIKITNEMLTKIANNPELMRQLLAMKEY